MHLIPIKTGRISPGEEIETKNWGIKDGDIVVVSSKFSATSENRVTDLSKLDPSDEAKKYSDECGRSPEFMQAVLNEMNLRNGKVLGSCPGAIFTELKPVLRHALRRARTEASLRSASSTSALSAAQHDIEGGWTIFTANAGMDESNIEKGYAVGWPENPVKSAQEIRNRFGNIAVIITDSCLRPRRWGVTAYALTCAGIDPIQDQAGENDLYGKPLHITKEAIADQLATAANILMGNADQGVPVVIIRDHNIRLSDFEGWVPGIGREEDIFQNMLS